MFEGAVESLSEESMTVDGVEIAIVLEGETATVIEGELELGAEVTVTARVLEDGSLVAISVEVAGDTSNPDGS